MVSEAYIPEEGDIVWLDFTPRAGHEQRGRVLTPNEYNRIGLALICPITNQKKGYPFEVSIPAFGSMTGIVLADQVRCLDWQARNASLRAKVSQTVLREVKDKLSLLLQI
jgi:mRNA interferase MazF